MNDLHGRSFVPQNVIETSCETVFETVLPLELTKTRSQSLPGFLTFKKKTETGALQVTETGLRIEWSDASHYHRCRN